MKSFLPTATVLALALGLSGCISFGAEPPERLLSLTAARTAAAGTAVSGAAESGVAVLEPAAPQRLTVTRVPVQVDASGVAYLKDAQWVERPARLFQRLLSETIQAGGRRLVVGDTDLQYAAATKLSGQLLDMGYDAPSSSAVVRFDAVLQMPDGQVRTRRFESIVPGIAADAAAVGPALNDAANRVAGEIADWVG
jgi:cholesterol transport system auxiliary component